MEKGTIKKCNEAYISQKAGELAVDYGFVKGFILDRVNEYYRFLSLFLVKNEKKINELLDKLKTLPRDIKNNHMLWQIKFINNIPKLIRIYGNNFDVDYVFLERHFLKIETQKEIGELYKNLNDLQKEIDISTDFNVKELYTFGNFILSFSTEFEFRKKIIIDLLKATLKSKGDDFKNIIDPKVMKNKNAVPSWNATAL